MKVATRQAGRPLHILLIRAYGAQRVKARLPPLNPKKKTKKGQPMSDSETKPSRKYARRLRVPVHPDEEQIIKDNAAKAGLPTAVYLRRLALGYEIRSVIDKQHIIELAKINADLGRLGGLLKLWLSNDERLVHIKPETMTVVLERIQKTQAALFEVVQKL